VDVELPGPGSGLVGLEAPNPVGTLHDDALAEGSATLDAVIGREPPARPLGWTFPDFRVREPRWTLTLAGHGGDVDHAATLSFGDASPLRALPRGPGWKLRLTGPEGEVSKVRVDRHGASLFVRG
jgi:hypothetical protein